MNNPSKQFCEAYGIQDSSQLEKLYEVKELMAFLPANPSPSEQEALRELIGVTSVSGYLDYVKSNNTFELIMQWREKTGNL